MSNPILIVDETSSRGFKHFVFAGIHKITLGQIGILLAGAARDIAWAKANGDQLGEELAEIREAFNAEIDKCTK